MVILESKVSDRFPPPSSLKQLEDVLREELYSIPLQTIQNLWVYSKKETSCITRKWWPNKCVSLTVVSIILSSPVQAVTIKFFCSIFSELYEIIGLTWKEYGWERSETT